MSDLISRQAAIDEIKSHYRVDNDLLEVIAYKISKLPSVQPKLKMGHWIYEKRKRLINETDEGAVYVTDYWCKCSKCGGDFGYRIMNDAFCKYCGAKMIEPKESEDKE